MYKKYFTDLNIGSDILNINCPTIKIKKKHRFKFVFYKITYPLGKSNHEHASYICTRNLKNKT